MGQNEASGNAHQCGEIEITEEMIEAGVRAYLGQASHDEMSFMTPRQLIAEVLRAALARRT